MENGIWCMNNECCIGGKGSFLQLGEDRGESDWGDGHSRQLLGLLY